MVVKKTNRKMTSAYRASIPPSFPVFGLPLVLLAANMGLYATSEESLSGRLVILSVTQHIHFPLSWSACSSMYFLLDTTSSHFLPKWALPLQCPQSVFDLLLWLLIKLCPYALILISISLFKNILVHLYNSKEKIWLSHKMFFFSCLTARAVIPYQSAGVPHGSVLGPYIICCLLTF